MKSKTDLGFFFWIGVKSGLDLNFEGSKFYVNLTLHHSPNKSCLQNPTEIHENRNADEM